MSSSEGVRGCWIGRGVTWDAASLEPGGGEKLYKAVVLGPGVGDEGRRRGRGSRA